MNEENESEIIANELAKTYDFLQNYLNIHEIFEVFLLICLKNLYLLG